MDNLSNKIRVILFDLDNTLLQTDKLEQFRTLGNESNLDSYEKEFSSTLDSLAEEKPYYFTNETLIWLIKRNILLGVVTKSPMHYAVKLLDRFFLPYGKKIFNVLITHEDVQKQKPNEEGIFRALNSLQEKFPELKSNLRGNEVLYVGNEALDVRTAYNAGCLAALKINDFEQIKEKNLDHLPELVIRTEADLKNIVIEPENCLPYMESSLQRTELKAPVFLNLNKKIEKKSYEIIVAGHYFPDTESFKCKHNFHKFSKEILEYKDKNEFPDAWLEALRKLLIIQTEDSIFGHKDVILTCIPHRKNREPRLENLLKQLANYLSVHEIIHDCTIHIVPDLLEYDDGAVSNHKEAKTKEKRLENVRNHLHVKRKDLITNQIDKIIIIDDVVTTGASLCIALEKVLKAGCKKITLFAYAQTISDRIF